MRRLLLLLLYSAPLFAQPPNGMVFTQGSLTTASANTFHPYATISGGVYKLNYDWDTGDPPQSCGQTNPATYNIQQNDSNPFGTRFESHYGDVGQNDNCADNPLHVRTELGNSGNPWPLTATTGASQTISASYYLMVEQPTGCTTLVSGQCLISSSYFVVGQFHPGSSSTFSGSASPAFAFDMPACLNEATPTSIGICPTGPYGQNFQIQIRQCETSLTACSSLPSPIFVYTMPQFNWGQYYAIQWVATYSQAGCMLNSDGTISATCYYPGGTSCSNVTCGSLSVLINGVQVVNYTGIVLGYPESSSMAQFTGSISGTTLTVGSVTGTITANQTVYGTGVTAGTTISSGSGTTWTVNNSQTVGSEAMTSGGSCPASNPGTIKCPYYKWGIYRQYPPNLENVVAHYTSVQFGTSLIPITPIGFGPWQ